jgi:hypothetical protein
MTATNYYEMFNIHALNFAAICGDWLKLAVEYKRNVVTELEYCTMKRVAYPAGYVCPKTQVRPNI